MEPEVIAAVIAGSAAVLVAILQVLRPFSDHAGYRRWAEIEQNAASESERQVAREFMDEFVLRLAVSDRTRRDRVTALSAAVSALVISSIIFVVATGVLESVPPVGWSLSSIALLIYLGALYLVVLYPDRLRDRTRAELTEQIKPPASSETNTTGITPKLVRWFSQTFRRPRRQASP